MLYIFIGLPGSGKTEIANKLSKKIDAVHINEDEVLRQLFSNPDHSTQERQRVYSKMFEQAEEFLQQGKEVILDATFIRRKNRERARDLARENGVRARQVLVQADENLIKQRLEQRFSESENDADFNVYLKYKKRFEPMQSPHILIENNSKNLTGKLKKILN